MTCDHFKLAPDRPCIHEDCATVPTGATHYVHDDGVRKVTIYRIVRIAWPARLRLLALEGEDTPEDVRGWRRDDCGHWGIFRGPDAMQSAERAKAEHRCHLMQMLARARRGQLKNK